MYEDYRDRGFIVVYLLDPQGGGSPEEWANQFGLTFPVLNDDQQIGMYRFDVRAWPSTSLLGPGMEVIAVDANITEDDIVAVLPR